MTATTNTPGTRSGKRIAAKALLVGFAAIAFTGLAAGAANAGTGDFPEITGPPSAGYVAAQEARASGQTEYSFEAFRETLAGFASIHVPGMTCPSGAWLQNVDLSPGRVVPRGVQVIEPGGVGVTIPHASRDRHSGEKSTFGTTFKLEGTDRAGNASATNWDPFSSRELVINLHCTTDPGKAATEFQPIGVND